MEKFFEFKDGSHISLKKIDDTLQITLQAKHLGETFKITTMSVSLNNLEIEDIIKWLNDNWETKNE